MLTSPSANKNKGSKFEQGKEGKEPGKQGEETRRNPGLAESLTCRM
jgi:hypothetical protein